MVMVVVVVMAMVVVVAMVSGNSGRSVMRGMVDAAAGG